MERKPVPEEVKKIVYTTKESPVKKLTLDVTAKQIQDSYNLVKDQFVIDRTYFLVMFFYIQIFHILHPY